MHDKRLRRLCATALLAAMILLVTAYVLHIPVAYGYIHLGDTVIYLAAVLLPAPYAMLAAALGGALADVVSGAAIWALPTAVIKALMVLPFTAEKNRFLCGRNVAATGIAGVIGVVGYAMAGAVLYGSLAAGVADMVPNAIQEIAGGGLFLALAGALDRAGVKGRLTDVL